MAWKTPCLFILIRYVDGGVARERLVEIVALNLVDADLFGELVLLFGFNAFGDNLLPEVVDDGNHVGEERDFSLLEVVVDEGFVELHEIDGELRHRRDGGITRAEIVEGDIDAALMHFFKELFAAFFRREDAALRNLDLDAVGGDAVAGQEVVEERGIGGVFQLAGGVVDGYDRQFLSVGFPLRELLDDFLGHDAVEIDDEATFLSGGDELVRIVSVVGEAAECLVSVDFLRIRDDLRLIEDVERFFLDGFLQILMQGLLAVDGLTDLFVVELEITMPVAVAAVIHGEFRHRQQVLEGFRILACGKAEGNADIDLDVFDGIGFLQVGDDALHAFLLFHDVVSEQQEELIAADADRPCTADGGKTLGQHLQQFVAEFVAVMLVDEFEIVDVEHGG